MKEKTPIRLSGAGKETYLNMCDSNVACLIRYALILAVAFTSLVIASLLWNIRHEQLKIELFALAEAKGDFNKDIVYRRWVASHGGVYVPVSEETPPNPHLAHIKERDITTPSGRKLTLLNPAYMTRQVYNLALKQYGILSHITSLKPINPANSPDPWEVKAMQAFEYGKTEVSSVETINGEEYMRLMRPMITEKQCLKCHSQHGYKLGDIHGGISVAVSMAPYRAIARERLIHLMISHVVLWILGLGLIGFGALHLRRRALEREKAGEALRKSEASLAVAQRIAHLGNWDWDIVNNELRWSDEIYRIFGLAPQEFGATYEAFLNSVHPEDREFVKESVNNTLYKNKPYSIDHRIILPDSSERIVHEQAEVTFDETGKATRMVGTVQDVTEHKRAEEVLRLIEEKFRQSQKMESIGRLAGGVAHDFNNILTTIIGNSTFLLKDLAPGDSRREDAEEIKEAAERAASLTRQLLAFSRKQVLQPRILDLDSVVANIDKLLRRLLGEDVELLTVLGSGLKRVKADPGQIEQVVMNLAVNARDAMPKGGKLTIEIAPVNLDKTYAAGHIDVKPGPYVMLSVSDTGSGMDKETQSRIFEPFFSTKEKDKGTGLGLSTVYGIIKQSGGNIYVYSEPEHGTTFKIYLPRVEGDASTDETDKVPAKSIRGSETVLLVEDEEKVRKMAGRTLKEAGYSVLEARHGEEALCISKEHKDPIHLMVTDVVMPRMSGTELAKRLTSLRPDIKVLYVSGYAENAITHHGILDSNVNFLEKPFTPDDFARKVREVLFPDKKTG